MSASAAPLTDASLPGLSAALDPEAMTALLHDALGASTAGALAERVVAIEVLKHKPGRRCAMALRLDGPAGGRRLFAKVFQTNRGASIYEKMSRAADALGGGPLRVPKPVAYVPLQRLLITEYVDGEPLSKALYAGASEGPARRMAAAIATFHGSGAAFPESWTVRDEIDNTRRWITGLRDLRDGAFERAVDLLAALEQCAQDPPTGPVEAIHRDFYPDQLLDRGPSTVLLDLDDARLGDPALDLGNCLAHLTLRPLQFPAVDRGCRSARAAFLGEYLRLRREALDQATLLEGVRFYEACSLLRLSGVYGARPRWAETIPPALLDACERLVRYRGER